MESDPRHADHQPHRVDGGDVRLLDDDGQTQAEDLLDDTGHAEGEARGVGDEEVLGGLHEEGDEAAGHHSDQCGQEQTEVLVSEDGKGGGHLEALECHGEWKEDNDHYWLDVIDHVKWIREAEF